MLETNFLFSKGEKLEADLTPPSLCKKYLRLKMFCLRKDVQESSLRENQNFYEKSEAEGREEKKSSRCPLRNTPLEILHNTLLISQTRQNNTTTV